jgi:hypothetical protein
VYTSIPLVSTNHRFLHALRFNPIFIRYPLKMTLLGSVWMCAGLWGTGPGDVLAKPLDAVKAVGVGGAYTSSSSDDVIAIIS